MTTICSVSYWRFISGFDPSGSNLGRPEQIGQFMQMVQRRINTLVIAHLVDLASGDVVQLVRTLPCHRIEH